MPEERVLDVKNLKIDFHTYAGEVKAIRNVSFHLNKGETLAIVGESGSGKSVTTRSIIGLLARNAKIEGGEIDFHGKDLLKLPEKEMQKIRGNEISMIFQDPMTSLDPTMKIGQQIAEPLIKHKGASKKEAWAKALEMMKAVGIPNAEERVLDVKNLKIDFHTYAGEVKAIRNVSFHLNKGETLAIVGESGSGKSVTTRSIIGLLARNAKIEGGEINFHGKNLLDLPEKEMQNIRGNEISMIFQDPMTSLDPTMKIGQQIAEPLIKHKGASKKEAWAKALEMMKAVGIPNAEERINEYPHQFSGGMRQRIVIAIALICEPEILLADEPTTALDVTVQAEILDLMKDLQKRVKTSIIFITHDLGVVAGMADRVAVMYAGEFLEFGGVDEIFYDPQHPYTWGLINSMPTLNSDTLESIPGTPPNLLDPPKGDPFAPRNKYAMKIDVERKPPFFKVSDSHYAATWLLAPGAPKVEPPAEIQRRWKKYDLMKKENKLPGVK